MKKRLPCLLLIACLVVSLNPVAAFADTTEHIEADGTSVAVDGNVNVSNEDNYAVEADNEADVVVNGNVTYTGGDSNRDGGGVRALRGSMVTVGDVTTTGTQNGFAGIVCALNGSSVTAGNVTTSGSMADGIFAEFGTVTAGNVTTSGDDAQSVMANHATVTVKDVVNSSPEGWDGIAVGSGSTITADNVTVFGREAAGVTITRYSDGTAIVKGDVTAKGENGTGVALQADGKVLVKGNVTSERNYGAIFTLMTAQQAEEADMAGAQPTLVVEGTLSGKIAPVAIVPASDRDGTQWVLDLEKYGPLPEIIVRNMIKGERWFVVVRPSDDGGYREFTGVEADVLGEAIMKNVKYIVTAKNLKVDGASRTSAIGNTYVTAPEGAALMLTSEIAAGYHLADLDLGAYAQFARQNTDGSYAIDVARGGNLAFAAETAKDSEPVDESDGSTKQSASKLSADIGSVSGNGQGATVTTTTPQTADSSAGALVFALLAGSASAFAAARKRMA